MWIFFDFDCTLTSVNFFNVKYPTHNVLINTFFGGPTRIAMLRKYLAQLSQTHTLGISSLNFEHVIHKSLTQVGLIQYFSILLGRESQIRHDKIATLVTHVGIKPKILLVDDDISNFTTQCTHHKNVYCYQVHNCGLTEKDMKIICQNTS